MSINESTQDLPNNTTNTRAGLLLSPTLIHQAAILRVPECFCSSYNNSVERPNSKETRKTYVNVHRRHAGRENGELKMRIVNAG